MYSVDLRPPLGGRYRQALFQIEILQQKGVGHAERDRGGVYMGDFTSDMRLMGTWSLFLSSILRAEMEKITIIAR